jgi:type IV secretory pathway VirB4 component
LSLSLNSIGDFLNLWHFFDDYLVFGDGSIGCGFKISGKDISCATEEEINQFTRKLEGLVSSLDGGLSLQFFYKLTTNVDGAIEEHRKLSEACPLENYGQILSSRHTHLQNKREDGHFFSPEIYLFLKGKDFGFQRKKIFQKEKDFTQVQEKEFKDHLENFKRSLSQIESSLRDCGILEGRLSKHEWFELFYEHFNLSRSESHRAPELKGPKVFSPSSLLSQFLLSDIFLSKKQIEIGDYKFRTISLKTLPDETCAGLINGLLCLPFHCWISQVVKICDQSKEYSSLQLKRRVAHSMASGQSNVSDLENESKLGQIEGLLSELIESSEKIVEADLTVIVWGRTETELEEKCDEVLRTFKRLNHSEGLVETFATFDTYLKVAPGICGVNRSKKMKSSNLAHLIPSFSYWRGNSKPVCLLPNRDNVLVSVDPFSPELPNWNGFIIGSSGSGKSFSINQLILMFIGDQT